MYSQVPVRTVPLTRVRMYVQASTMFVCVHSMYSASQEFVLVQK